MDKFPRLNYRPKKARPFIVRYYDSASNKRTSRSFSARMDAMQFLAKIHPKGKRNVVKLKNHTYTVINAKLQEIMPSVKRRKNFGSSARETCYQTCR